MTFALVFLAAVIAVYILICLVSGAICGTIGCKKDIIYYSVSSEAGYNRLIKYLELYPEKACKIVCINNADDDDLSKNLLEQADKFGFKVI